MRFLHIPTLEVVELLDSDTPFAILSHTWGSEAPGSEQWAVDRRPEEHLSIHEKVNRACQDAIRRNLSYLWVDSLCIDASSSADLDEAVNGSFQRLSKCSVCLVYLDDLPADGRLFDRDVWARCRYWSRSWTLQELVIPPRVEFFDKDWNYRCSKTSPDLLPLLSDITGIPRSVLLDASALSDISLAGRISWSANRSSSREEDAAYSLTAITGVTMPVRYGEGAARAFLRLQEEILHDTRDGSIFAWKSDGNQGVRGLLARSPSEFRHFAGSADLEPWTFDGKVQFSSKGIRVQSRISEHESCVLLEIGRHGQDEDSSKTSGICLREWNGIYVRVNPASVLSISKCPCFKKLDVARDVDSRSSTRIEARFNHSFTVANGDRVPASDIYSSSTKIEKKNEIARTVYTLPWRPAQRSESSATQHESGTKRNRCGRPVTPTQHQHDCPKCFCFDTSHVQDDDVSSSSKSELDGSCSSSVDDSVGDADEELEESTRGDGESALYMDQKLQSLQADLLQFSYDRVQTWMSSARYAAPPENRPPPRKRARTGDWPSSSTLIEDNDDQDDPQLVIVTQLDGHFHMVCPFYASNPDKYRRCLLEHDLKTIPDVIRHLRRHHTEPPYCPMCRRAFDAALDRDEHIRARTCEFSSSGDTDGINERQKAKLLKRDEPRRSGTERWLRVWATVFPDRQPPPSPYLQDGVEKKVSMVRDYWASNGRVCISDFFKGRNDACYRNVEGQTLEAFTRLTLKALLSKVVEEYTRL